MVGLPATEARQRALYPVVVYTRVQKVLYIVLMDLLLPVA